MKTTTGIFVILFSFFNLPDYTNNFFVGIFLLIYLSSKAFPPYAYRDKNLSS